MNAELIAALENAIAVLDFAGRKADAALIRAHIETLQKQNDRLRAHSLTQGERA